MSELEPLSPRLARRATLKAVLPARSQTTSAPIRVLIADGQPLFRDGLRKVLETQADFSIVGEVGDGAEAVRQTVELAPDILLLDPAIPQLSGIEVLRAVRQANVDVATILLTTDLEMPVIVEMLQLGARGYVSRATSTDLLFKSIRKVREGELWIGREAMTEVVRALAMVATAGRTPMQDFGLTRREREILTLVVEGDTNKGIARRLSVGQDTVKHHLTSIFNKTGVSSRLELALFALHYHLVDKNDR